VVLVIDTPGLDVDPKSCLAGRPITISTKSIQSCVSSRKSVDDRNRKYKELISEIRRRNPLLSVYDSQSVFCDEASCFGGDEKSIFYFDTNHLSLSGSARVLKDFDRWLVQEKLKDTTTNRLEVKFPSFTNQINKAPLFESKQNWSDGYLKAIGHGAGVVVGPGAENANIFTQSFTAKANESFKIVARASSVNKLTAMGRIQINWVDPNGKFISVSTHGFEVTPRESTVEHYVVAPPGVATGILYVTADGSESVVRYTEMRLLGAAPPIKANVFPKTSANGV
jgi:hypothetical protein